jgi:hypothetical protein
LVVLVHFEPLHEPLRIPRVDVLRNAPLKEIAIFVRQTIQIGQGLDLDEAVPGVVGVREAGVLREVAGQVVGGGERLPAKTTLSPRGYSPDKLHGSIFPEK